MGVSADFPFCVLKTLKSNAKKVFLRISLRTSPIQRVSLILRFTTNAPEIDTYVY